MVSRARSLATYIMICCIVAGSVDMIDHTSMQLRWRLAKFVAGWVEMDLHELEVGLVAA